MAPDLLTALRASTRAAHAALERGSLLAGLLAPEVGLEAYRRALLQLLALQRWQDAWLRAAATDGEVAALVPGELLGAGRAGDLLADLAWLGVTPPDADLEAPPPAPAGLAEALGILYVSEGSRRGGAVMGRHLAERLGLGPGGGLRFFLGAPGDQPAARWEALLALLAGQSGRGEPFCARAVAAACRCFEEADRRLKARSR